MMIQTRVFLEAETIRVPEWVVDLESFRRWSDDDDFPERGRSPTSSARSGST